VVAGTSTASAVLTDLNQRWNYRSIISEAATLLALTQVLPYVRPAFFVIKLSRNEGSQPRRTYLCAVDGGDGGTEDRRIS
jgi:hypothetical protein